MEVKREKIDRGNVERPSNGDSTLRRLIVQKDRHLARVDKPLLVFKAFYFFIYSALATTFPFLPSYFQQIGLSPYQVQILSVVRPFIQLFLSPLWGIVADRYLPKKMILQFCTFVWMIGTISLAFVEPTGQICQLISVNNTNTKVINSTEMQTGFFRRKRSTDAVTTLSTLQSPNLYIFGLNKDSHRERFKIVEIPLGSGSGLSASDVQGGGSGSGALEYSDHESLNASNKIKDQSFVKISTSKTESKSSNDSNLTELNFTIRNELRENSSRLYHIFLGALALVAFEEVFLCPVLFLMDAVLLSKTEDGAVSYANQRMFGSLGFLIFFLITGTLLNNSLRPVCGQVYADYIINVCLFCIITIIAQLVLIKLDVSCFHLENSPYERLKTIYYSKHYGSFIAATCFMGFSHTVISNFHSEYLAESKVGHGSAGTINFFRFLGEPLAFFLISKLITRAGSMKNITVGSLLLYMLNHFACSFVSTPWQLIPFGFLEGFTYGCSWVVCVTYLASSTPSDCVATAQGVLQCIYCGLGGSLGLTIGDSIISLIGPTFAFRLFAMLAVPFAVAFTVGLKDVNFRGNNYYTLLLNALNICTDVTKTQQTNTNTTLSRYSHGPHADDASVYEYKACEDARGPSGLEGNESSFYRRYYGMEDEDENSDEKFFVLN